MLAGFPIQGYKIDKVPIQSPIIQKSIERELINSLEVRVESELSPRKCLAAFFYFLPFPNTKKCNIF